MNRTRKSSFLAVLLLLWLFGVLTMGSRALSLTLDEPAHIAVGYAILARGKDAFWLLPLHGHPPLLNVLEAALLYLANPHIPVEQLDGWASQMPQYIGAFYPYLRPLERTEMLSRTPVIWLTLILGALIYRWGRRLGGPAAGLIGLGVLCFDPILLAHGRLATTDVGTVALGTAGLYLTWRWMAIPGWRKAAEVGGLLGLTMLSKGSGVLWVVAVGLMVLWRVACERKSRWGLLAQGVTMGIGGFLILWVGYALSWGPVHGLPGAYPAPEHWNGLITQAVSAEERWVFALGLRKHGHWWWYFPLAFLIKNPIPLLVALVGSLFFLSRRPLSPDTSLSLLLFTGLYAVVSVVKGMNIGYRHLIPIHPTMYLLIGRASVHWWTTSKYLRRGLLFLGLWYIVGTLRMFPYEIAYFNELVDGPQHAHQYLVDSNLDWGQGYKALRLYLERHPGPVPKLAPRFTYVRPEDYGILAEELPPAENALPLDAPFHPAPGRYILSITTLQQGWPTDNEMYAWFRLVEPSARVGHSFFVYDVSSPPLKWLSQCVIPTIPLSDSVITYGLGQGNLRRVDFDCAMGWIYPSGGQDAGAYGFHRTLFSDRNPLVPSLSTPVPRDPFLTRRLGTARLSLDMRRYTPDFPAFVLYEQREGPVETPMFQTVAISFAESTELGGREATTPIALDGPLSFLGAYAVRERTSLEVETWWQVLDGPINRQFSFMGHLLTQDGKAVGVSDGLAVSPDVLLSGDILVQRHRFSIPDLPGPFLFQTGAYWLDTMERWGVRVDGKPAGDQILLSLTTNP
jgi:4-amino-4-deoxy-L-arabinose transferase-like glycosyltransferase